MRITVTREKGRNAEVNVDGERIPGVTNLKVESNVVSFSAAGKSHSYTIDNWRITGQSEQEASASSSAGSGSSATPSGTGSTSTGGSGTTR